MKKLTHLNDQGAARMVDVSDKPVTDREASAEAIIVLSAEAFTAAKSGNAPKGDVLATARIAGIMAAKRTPDLIPLCHPIAVSKAEVAFEWIDERNAVRIVAAVKTSGQTGVEMEALMAASVAALTIYDMIKGIDKSAVIETVRLLAKSGGKSGDYTAPVQKAFKPVPAVPKSRAKPKVIMSEGSAPRPGPHAQREAFREFMASHRLRPTQWAKDAGVPAAQILAYLTGQSRTLTPRHSKKACARGEGARRGYVPVISVDEAVARVVKAFVPVESETVAIDKAHRRVLAEEARARMTQPPAPVSSMDGYAVRATDVANAPATLKLVGSSPAGHPFGKAISNGETVRIFTGGVVPDGADSIVIQEDAVEDGERVTLSVAARPGKHIRVAGLDFRTGDVLAQAGRRLTARDVSLLASGDLAQVTVRRKPRIALAATGDELTRPGEPRGPGGIVASSGYALSALIETWGGETLDLGILPDTMEAIGAIAERASGADLIVTMGGASVGDHDLIQKALGPKGFALDFWKIAMRPGKPLIFGKLGATPLLGLPGNPVSTLVCAILFLRPAIAAMLGADTKCDAPDSAPDAQPRPPMTCGRTTSARRLMLRGRRILGRTFPGPGFLDARHARRRQCACRARAARARRGKRRRAVDVLLARCGL